MWGFDHRSLITVQGGFYFHPSDVGLSPGTPVEEKATQR
jgi:hypothetical protein